MNISQLSELGDTFVIHFDTEVETINAYTPASALVGIADAAKAANATLNLGYDIEIVVEAIGPGSFRTMLRAIYTEARNLFSGESARALILGVIATFIYERAFSIDHAIKIEVYTNEVVIQSGQDKVIVPRSVYDATREAAHNPSFVRGIGKTLESIGADDRVQGIGFVSKMDSPPPDIVIPQKVIREIEIDVPSEPITRVVEEQCDLQIVKAILEESTRKWEFMWRGVKISAPVLDSSFYSKFYAHNITIAPGDELKVRLVIKQDRDARTGIYANVAYEVREVFDHVKRMRQVPLSSDEDNRRSNLAD